VSFIGLEAELIFFRRDRILSCVYSRIY